MMHMPWGDIPARPYIGVSDAEAEEIEDLTLAFVGAALAGGRR